MPAEATAQVLGTIPLIRGQYLKSFARPAPSARTDAQGLQQRDERAQSCRYRAVNSTGAMRDCMLSATRDVGAAERFYHQVLQAAHTRTPWGIMADKHPTCSLAFEVLQHDGTLPETCLFRQCRYSNNGSGIEEGRPVPTVVVPLKLVRGFLPQGRMKIKLMVARYPTGEAVDQL